MTEQTHSQSQSQSQSQTIQPGTLPEAWEAIGATYCVTVPTAHEVRMLISGEGGVGKTTFVGNIPRAVHIDCDGGAHSVVDKRAATVTLRAMGAAPHQRGHAVYANVISQLLKDAKNGDDRPFHTVIIDTLDTWFEMLAAHTLEEVNKKSTKKTYATIGEYGDQGSGYAKVYDRAMFDLKTLYDAGYRWVVVGHLQEKEITVGGNRQTVTRPGVGKGLFERVRNRADVEAQIYEDIRMKAVRKNNKITGDKEYERTHKLVVESNAQRQAKHRVPNLSGELAIPRDGGWDTFEAFYNEKRDRTLKEIEEIKALRNSG